MTHSTLTEFDIGRRNLGLLDQRTVNKSLPEYYREKYPKLVTFMEKYYQWADSDVSPSHLLQDMYVARDIGQTPDILLDFLEDELLLGQEYFGGFKNKRAAAKISNTFYRSKGTKYSIQQFFNMFFGIDVDVVYTKKDRMMVGESQIGYEAQKFITNAELYQVFAVLIKSELPQAAWEHVYKLFVHPAGMFLGSQVQVVSVGDLTPGTDSAIPADIVRTTQGDAAFTLASVADTTGIMSTDSDLGIIRIDNNTIGQQMGQYDAAISMGLLDSAYDNIAQLIGTNSVTFDEDSGAGGYGIITMDNILERMDEVEYTSYDSNGPHGVAKNS